MSTVRPSVSGNLARRSVAAVMGSGVVGQAGAASRRGRLTTTHSPFVHKSAAVGTVRPSASPRQAD